MEETEERDLKEEDSQCKETKNLEDKWWEDKEKIAHFKTQVGK